LDEEEFEKQEGDEEDSRRCLSEGNKRAVNKCSG
jgi:hypothetical protein